MQNASMPAGCKKGLLSFDCWRENALGHGDRRMCHMDLACGFEIGRQLNFEKMCLRKVAVGAQAKHAGV